MEKEKTTPEEVETLREKNKKVIDFLDWKIKKHLLCIR